MTGLLGVVRVRRRHFDLSNPEGWRRCIGLLHPGRSVKAGRFDVSGQEDNFASARGEEGLAAEGVELIRLVEGHQVVVLGDEALAAEACEEAADGFAGEAGHIAELLMGEMHEEGDGEMGRNRRVVQIVHASQVEESAGEPADGGAMESEATGREDGAVVLAGHGTSGGAADVGVGFHEVDEVGAGNGLDDAGDEGFGGDAIECAHVQSGEAKDIAGAGDAQEEETAFCGGGGEFDLAAADDQEVVGGEAFADEDGAGFAMAADADRVEVAQDGTGERTGVQWIGSRSLCKAARKHGGPPRTQRKVACA